MNRDEVAEILNQIGTILEIKGENPFKSRAYFNAARTLETLKEPLEKLLQEQKLGQIKGIGDALEKKIQELVTTGRLGYYEDLKNSIPPGLLEILNVPGLGPKKIKALNSELGIESLAQLETACLAGKVAVLDGFGEKTQSKILEGIAFRKSYASRFLISQALMLAEPILERLRIHPSVIRCSTAGSLRRHKEIVGDMDFLASSRSPISVIEDFVSNPEVITVLGQGETKASVVLTGGIQADLRVVEDRQFPFALAYFTGSKEHNIVMRQRAIERKLRLNEYGLFRSEVETKDPQLCLGCRTEEEIFAALDLPFIPPEIREDVGEFDAGERNEIPTLIDWTDLKGSLHNHSDWSDGRGSIEEIARHMIELGLSYWAVTDHSKSSVQASGLQPDRLLRQISEIEKLNIQLQQEGEEFRLLTGTEVDILTEGRLDFDDELLGKLDVVVASIHQSFTQSEAEITRRLIRAAENRQVHMLGHLTGRLLLEREAYKVNQRAVIDACAATGTWIELNASPYRMDMDWRLWAYAKEKGVKCVINCDAHRNEQAGFLKLGAGIARKGWLTRKDVINTLPLDQLRLELRKKRGS